MYGCIYRYIFICRKGECSAVGPVGEKLRNGGIHDSLNYPDRLRNVKLSCGNVCIVHVFFLSAIKTAVNVAVLLRKKNVKNEINNMKKKKCETRKAAFLLCYKLVCVERRE